MKSQELEIDILKRQNREIAIKMQIYRSQNQQLKTKNQELNLWVGNLSQVFSTVSASWESITILQQTLFTLMKKRSDMKDKTLLRKYQFHFKTFSDIINNLSDKIKNTGHSDQATMEAKEQLRSFVKNYQLIFKQFVQTYFKYNQQFSQFMTNLLNRQDPKDNVNVRNILNKSLESTQKIKQFQTYIQALKQNFQKFQEFNNQKLLQGVVRKKQEQIQALTQKVNLLQRRIKIIFDYSNASVDLQLNCKQEDFQCKCGGAQVAYMKSVWEQKINNFNKNNTHQNHQESKNGMKSQSVQGLEAKLAAVQEEKQNLIIRNSLLMQKISKMNVQYKLTDQIVLRSSVYLSLKDQCQYLMDYVTQLINKLKKQQQIILVIQKARDDELRQLKRKFQKSKAQEDKNYNSSHNNSNYYQVFKTQALSLIKNLSLFFNQSNKINSRNQENLNSFKQTFEQLRKSNVQLNLKVNDLQQKQLTKSDGLQFKYQKFKQIQTTMEKIIQKQNPQILELWKQFILHFKGRDKKLKDLQSSMRKKDREISQKTQIQTVMRESLTETQKIYTQNKQKLDKTTQFIKKMQQQLLRLAQQNYQIRSQLQQDKTLLNLKLKAQNDARMKLQQKMTIVSKIQTQFSQISQNQIRLLKDYQIWIGNNKKSLDDTRRQLLQKDLLIKNATQEANEKQKQLQKLQVQKQNLKSEIRQLKGKVDSLMATTENQVLKMQLNEYKGKIMCSCTGDRQRQVVLKTCPHLFCKRCIDDTTNNRNRKCPLCGIRFTKTDIHEIKWN